jgi:hypothetical protein
MQELLLGVLLCCNFIELIMAENMQSLCTSLERDSLILVFFFSWKIFFGTYFRGQVIAFCKLSPLLVW